MSLRLFPKVVRAVGDCMADAPDFDGYSVGVGIDLPSPCLVLTLRRAGRHHTAQFDRHYEDYEVRYFVVKAAVCEIIKKADEELPKLSDPARAQAIERDEVDRGGA
jgi:hypothetical protein